MLFCIHAADKPGALETRLANREAHLAYIQDNYNGKMVCAGPLLADDGETMIGSMIIIDLADEAAVRSFCENDPYAKAGLFESTEVWRFKHVFPRQDG